MSAALTMAGLAVRRGDRTLVAGLDARIRPGEIWVVLGPNGAGKSSLLMALAGLIPFMGKIEIGGVSLHAMSRAEIARRIAWQGFLPPADFGLTVRERITLAGAASAERATVALEALDLESLSGRRLASLSSGERQRVELAAVVAREAPFWLFDEPTAHLDLCHQVGFFELLRSPAGSGRGIVLVLHDIAQAEAVADRVILLDGRGGCETGDAEAMLDPARLGRVFRTRLERRPAILPDYGGRR